MVRRTDTARPPRDGELSWDEFLAAGEGQSGAAEDTARHRSGVHPRHLGHDRQAEARRPHPRRLCGPRRIDGRLGVRSPGGRDLVVDVGHRLGRRPRLHRLRAADGRCHDARLRGRDRPPRPQHGVVDHRARGRDRRLHLADGGPAPDALRRGVPQAARPPYPRAAVLGGRGPQRPRLGVAPEDRLRGPHPGHRPHVADGDGRPDLRHPVRLRDAPDQARLRRGGAARDRGGHRRPGRPARSASTRRA